ncbi:MAG: SRPBCC domain-containing protein [Acidimicrobiales bacterium]
MDIRHRIGARSATPDQVFAALTTLDGLSGWWTTDTTGDPDLGGRITFRFAGGTIEVEVRELDAGKRVGWTVVGGPDDWLGTTITFELREEDDFTIVSFRHEGWASATDFMDHCSTKWAVFLLSLKSLLETGAGAPHPDDQEVDSWD